MKGQKDSLNKLKLLYNTELDYIYLYIYIAWAIFDIIDYKNLSILFVLTQTDVYEEYLGHILVILI